MDEENEVLSENKEIRVPASSLSVTMETKDVQHGGCHLFTHSGLILPNCSWWRNHDSMLRMLYVLFLGQIVSFILSLISFTASLVANHGVDAPLTLSFFSYLALNLVYGSILLYRHQKLLVPWYWYLLLGFVDAQGSYLFNKAFQYSSITSVTLLDCCTIVWVMVLAWFFMGTRYSLWQFFSAALCVLGLGLVILSDAGVGGRGGSKPLLGDVLVVAATIFFAVSNVGEEFCVKKTDRVEVLSMIGLFGTLVTGCEIAIMERKSLESVKWSAEITGTDWSLKAGIAAAYSLFPVIILKGTPIIAFIGFALSNFMFYTLVPFVLKMSGATMLNLSLLTSDMWAVVIRIFFYRQQVGWLYYLSFAIVVVGLIIYSKSEKDPVRVQALEDGNLKARYRVLTEECDESREDTIASR